MFGMATLVVTSGWNYVTEKQEGIVGEGRRAGDDDGGYSSEGTTQNH
jgi:hypothetical protein